MGLFFLFLVSAQFVKRQRRITSIKSEAYIPYKKHFIQRGYLASIGFGRLIFT